MGSSSVLNNIASLVAQQSLQKSGMGLEKTLFRLSTGLRIRSGADDAAGLAIADGLRGQIRTLQQSTRNANDGIGFVQTADSALSETQNLLTRAASLLTQAATDTNSGQLAAIEGELAQIYQEIDRIGSGTKFNATDVFTNTSIDIFVGDSQNATSSNAAIAFVTSALSLSDLAVSGGVTGTGSTIAVDIDNAVASKSATQMLVEVDAAIDTVAQKRGTLGAKINRMEGAVGVIQSQIQNLTAAESQIRDANVAEEVANLTRFQILNQTGLAALAQANAASQGILALF